MPDLASLAGFLETKKSALKASKPLELVSHLIEVSAGNLTHGGAGLLRPIGDSQEAPNLIERKSKFPASPNKSQALNLVGSVVAISARRAGRRDKHASLLVEPNRFDHRLGEFREFSNSHFDLGH